MVKKKTTCEVISPTLSHNYAWRLRDVPTGKIIIARMEDQDFLKRVASGDIGFIHGSHLEISLEIIISFTPQGNTSYKYRIVKVHKVTPPRFQTKFNFEYTP